MRKGIQIKTIRNLNLDHPGGKCQILTIRGGIEGNEEVNPPRMVKIQHFPPKWSRFRFLMVLIWIPFLISPPNGQDSAQICSKCQLQFLRLMALPVIEESSYLGATHPQIPSSSPWSLGPGTSWGNVYLDVLRFW